MMLYDKFLLTWDQGKGFSGGLVVKNLAGQCRRHKRCGFNTWVGKILWWRKWQSAPVFLSRKFHRQRSWSRVHGGHKTSNMTEHLSTAQDKGKGFVKFMRLAYYFKMFLLFPGDKIILAFWNLMKELDAQTQSGTYFTLMVRKSFQAIDSWSFSLCSFL